MRSFRGPPDNELPATATLEPLTWRGPGVVIAVPQLLVYTSGVEATVLCLSQREWALDTREMLDQVTRGINGKSGGPTAFRLGVTGTPLMELGGEHRERSFRHRVWVPLPRAEEFVMFCEWAAYGISYAEHRVMVQTAVPPAVLW
jgi:hypothetical protein